MVLKKSMMVAFILFLFNLFNGLNIVYFTTNKDDR